MYLLDTNVVSYIIKGDVPSVRQRLATVPIREVNISVVTQAEMLYGLAKRHSPVGLTQRVEAFLIRVHVLPWTTDVARRYADLRAEIERGGISLAAMDMMIAAHALALNATLVTHDRAFAHVNSGVVVERWA